MSTNLSKFRRRMRRVSRFGAAIVEFAVMAPIIILIVFSTIDICSLFYLRQSCKLAAYEGCRIGLTPAGTDTLISNQVTRVLNSRRIKGFKIATNPSLSTVTPGQLLTVRVTAPRSSNLPLRGWLTGSGNVVAEVKMASER